MKKKILLAILLFGVIGLGIAAYLFNKPAETSVSGKADFTMPAEELYAAFEQNEAMANEKYLNKIIKVQGEIASISEADSLGLNVTLSGGEGMFGVSCQVPEPGQEAAEFKVGEPLVVKGLCTGKLMDVVLVKGVIEQTIIGKKR